jgi:GTP cyclohydrolase I
VTSTSTTTLTDVQSRRDDRNIPIDLVGVSDLRYPIVVWERGGGRQETIAQIAMSVSLPHDFKGTHMSRFIEVLNRHRGEVTIRTMPLILADLKQHLDAERARVEVAFPYFMERTAPVSQARSLMDYECRFVGELSDTANDFILTVTVPVNSLCPCSKEISDYGAHNQRGYVTVEVRCGQDEGGAPAMIWIEEVVEVVEQSASSPVYPLLKRVDERHVTMQAYENPAFVEDIVRNVIQVFREDPRPNWLKVTAVNDESIHNHRAFAQSVWTRTDRPS